MTTLRPLPLILLATSLLALAACAETKGAPLTPDAEPGGVSCEKEIALECPEGQIDACLVSPPAGPTHRCVERADADAGS